MNVRRLTPHPVAIHVDGTEIVLPAGIPTPHVEEQRTALGTGHVDGHEVPLHERRASSVVDLPDPGPRVGLIVARVVAAGCPTRTDLFVPYQVLRDEQGRTIGCRSLARVLPARSET